MTPSRDLGVRPAREPDRRPLAQVLGRAFGADDPFFSWLIPDRETRPARTARVHGAELRLWMTRGEVLTTADLTGAAMWAPPNRWNPGWWGNLRLAPAMLGAMRTAVLRAAKVWPIIEKAHPHDPHWYLAVLGTDPDHQGRGVASALVNPVLERCDADGLGAYLETMTPTNVAFYERFGFEVRDRLEDLPAGAPDTWLMWRDPR